MFEKYVEEAQRAIFFARYEAQQQGISCIEWQHLLLGIVREGGSIEPFKLRPFESTVRTWLPSSNRKPLKKSAQIPLSTESKRALAFAAEEAAQLGHNYIFSDHLLLGLLRIEGSLHALTTLGLDLSSAREVVKHSAFDRNLAPATPYRGAQLTFLQRYAAVLILIALAVGLVIGFNLRD